MTMFRQCPQCEGAGETESYDVMCVCERCGGAGDFKLCPENAAKGTPVATPLRSSLSGEIIDIPEYGYILEGHIYTEIPDDLARRMMQIIQGVPGVYMDKQALWQNVLRIGQRAATTVWTRQEMLTALGAMAYAQEQQFTVEGRVYVAQVDSEGYPAGGLIGSAYDAAYISTYRPQELNELLERPLRYAREGTR